MNLDAVCEVFYDNQVWLALMKAKHKEGVQSWLVL